MTNKWLESCWSSSPWSHQPSLPEDSNSSMFKHSLRTFFNIAWCIGHVLQKDRSSRIYENIWEDVYERNWIMWLWTSLLLTTGLLQTRHWDAIKLLHSPNLKASGTGNLWSETSEDNRCNSPNTKTWKPALPRIKNGRLCLSLRRQVDSTPSLVLSLLLFYLVASLLNSVCSEQGDYT